MTFTRSLQKGATEARILDAASRLFARHGFKASTTREIANLAGINEATLFRYFLRKPDLFWAAFESRLGWLELGADLQASLEADHDPAIVLPMLVTFLLDALSQDPELSRLLHVAAFERPKSDRTIGEYLRPIFDVVSGYFQRCVARGIIGEVEPTLATLGLVGLVSAHQAWQQLFTDDPLPKSDPEETNAAYVQLWLQALKSPTADTTNRAISPRAEITV